MPESEPKLWETAVRIVKRLRDEGHEALFAGGCVRDRLMGIPAKDVDIATSARPDVVKSLFPRCLGVGESFGVVIVLTGGSRFEVATFRLESDYEDGRHPGRVKYSDARQDVERRDFTINGLLLDPLDGDRVIDYVGGQADLEKGVIRAIGEPERRFAEDHLRMLRALRFAARFGFEIEPATFMAIREQVRSIHRVSAERINEELIGIFTCPRPDRGLGLLDESGLLAEVLPEVEALKSSGDVYSHTRAMLGSMKDPTETLAFGVLLQAFGQLEAESSTVEKICGRLRFSREQTRRIKALVENHSSFRSVETMSLRELKRFLRQEHFEEHLELHRLDCESGDGDLSHWEFCCCKLEEIPEDRLWPPRLLTGDDLLEMGFDPGPKFKEILLAVENAQLEETLVTAEEAKEFVLDRWPPSGASELDTKPEPK